MSSFKVDVAFLKGPVPAVINTCTHIVKCMTNNSNFSFPPVSPPGLQTAVSHLKEMQGKIKPGTDKSRANLEQALADVDDYIMQLAQYVNHASNYNMEKLLSSGFSLHNEEKRGTPPPATATQMELRNGKKPCEIIAVIEQVLYCKVAIGRISTDPKFPAESTTEVTGSSGVRVSFSALPAGASVWVAVKCRGSHGDGEWCVSQSIIVR